MREESNVSRIPFWERYTLTVNEACDYFHIGEKKFREILEDDLVADYIIRSGKRIMTKRKRFEHFIDSQYAI